MEFVIISSYLLFFGTSSRLLASLASRSRLFSDSLNYTSGLRFVFPINAHRHAVMNQSEARLHSGRSVHFRPWLRACTIHDC